jgi:hypothetical protein
MQSFLLKLHSLAVLGGGLERNSPFVGFIIDSVLSHMSGGTMDDRERGGSLKWRTSETEAPEN